jgi:hypothetical protein
VQILGLIFIAAGAIGALLIFFDPDYGDSAERASVPWDETDR